MLVHNGDIMKPLGDVQENLSYSMKISVNNEISKYFSTTQKVQKELWTARNMEHWYYWKGKFYDKDVTLGKLEEQVLSKGKLMGFTILSFEWIPSVVILSVRRAYTYSSSSRSSGFPLRGNLAVWVVENCNQ